MSRSFAGDIGLLMQMPFKHYDQYAGYSHKDRLPEEYIIKYTHVMSYDKLPVDDTLKILNIGDSFSAVGTFSYQNYLAYFLGNRITNIAYKPGNNHLNIAISLLNSGIIDSVNCRVAILQIVGRETIWKLCDIDFNLLYEIPNVAKNYFEGQKFIPGLYNFCSFIRLRLNYDNPVYKRELKKAYFTHPFFSQKLYHYSWDMEFVKQSKVEIETAHENLIRLHRHFANKGIKMIFLIAADKYDVYRPFMKDNSLPVDTTTDGFSKIPDVCVIDTKPLLQDMVQNGEKDVYMLHDSHWSYKGSAAVAREIIRHLDIQNVSD